MNEQRAFEAMNLIDDRFLNEALKPRRRRLRLSIGVAAGIAAVLILFFATVNLFPRAALSLSEIPVLGEIAKAIMLDPSMRACFTNDYAQYVGMRDEADPYHSQVYYMVVDASRISVFFWTDASTLRREYDTGAVFDIESVTDENGAKIPYSGSIYETDVKGLHEYRMDLDGRPVPTAIPFTIRYFQDDWTREVARATYTLNPDTAYAKIVESHVVNATAVIDGQTITIDRVDIYPTQAKLFFNMPSTNDRLLKKLNIVLRDEKGRTYPPRSHGTTGTLTDESEVLSLWYESPYFEKVEYLEAVVTAYSFLSKSEKYGMIDLKTSTIGHMPEGVSLTAMTLDDEGSLEIALKVKISADTVVAGYDGPNGSSWFYESGYSYQPVYWPDAENEMTGIYEEDYEYQVFSIPDYRDGTYSLEWNIGPVVELDEPLMIPLIGREN